MTPAGDTAAGRAAQAQSPAFLCDGLDADVFEHAPIGAVTWFAAGGSADLRVVPRSLEALCELSRRCSEQGIPVRVLGDGANLLVLDEGVDGVVVDLCAPAFTQAQWEGTDPACESLVRIGAGADLFALVQECKRLGRSGLAQMAGIPASIGGAVCMNAGGAYGDIAQCLERVEVMLPGGTPRTLAARELRLGYRHCELPAGCIVTAAVLRLPHGDRREIEAQVHEIFEYKKSTQPMGAKSAGCMFRNPSDPATGTRESAGRLIDRAGLKGLRVGSAFVSPCHGNFLSLDRGGRARDVLELSLEVQQRVLAHSGRRLVREVVVWSRHAVPSFPGECE